MKDVYGAEKYVLHMDYLIPNGYGKSIGERQTEQEKTKKRRLIMNELFIGISVFSLISTLGLLAGIIRALAPKLFWILTFLTAIFTIVILIYGLATVDEQSANFSWGAFVGGLIAGWCLIPFVHIGEKIGYKLRAEWHKNDKSWVNPF